MPDFGGFVHRRLAIAAAITVALATLVPVASHANARLASVTALDAGCVSGPTGAYVEAWDVQQGKTYRVRLEGVTDCAHGGTDPTLNVIVMNSVHGNTPLVASLVSTGIYEFDFRMPMDACETSPIQYCTAGGNTPSTGLLAGRHDDGTYQGHLRAAVFDGSCGNPRAINCVTGSLRNTWGSLKSIYR